jgi:hypothetical protein
MIDVWKTIGGIVLIALLGGQHQSLSFRSTDQLRLFGARRCFCIGVYSIRGLIRFAWQWNGFQNEWGPDAIVKGEKSIKNPGID